MKTTLGLLVLAIPFICLADVVVPVDSVERYVNIRQAPEADTDIVGRLQRGVPLTLVQSVPGWHEVVLDDEGTTGFVSADWSTVIPDGPDAVVEEGVVAEIDEETAKEAIEEAVEEAVVEEAIEEAVEEAVVEQVVEEVIEVAVIEEAVEEVIEEADVEQLVEAAVVEETPEPTVITGGMGPPGPMGPAGPPGPAGEATIKGTPGYLVRFKDETTGGESQIYDDGNQIGIGTTEPKQRLEVNGSIQIHEKNSSVAGLMITQSSGDTGYIMHNRASTLTLGAGSVDRITIDRNGLVGIGVSRPLHPLEMTSGAHVTAGGVWTNSSSRSRKENISELSLDEALTALAALEPVQFNYKSDTTDSYVGFIAEDVPELVATSDRQGLSAMDIVAVLTRVIQEQQRRIEDLEAKVAD